MRSKRATHRAFSPPATYALVAWPPSRNTSFAQQTLDILRLVEILGGVEADRRNQPRRGEVRPIEIGAIERDAGAHRAELPARDCWILVPHASAPWTDSSCRRRGWRP